jgi:hypothetical protein
MERLARDKHTSILRALINYHVKSFITGTINVTLSFFRKQIRALKFEHKKDVEALIGQFSELKTLKTELSALPEVDTVGTKICSKDVDQKSSKVVDQKLSKNVVQTRLNFVDQKSSKNVERDNLQTVEQKSSKVVEQKSSKVVDEFSFRPIGVVRSCHLTKNGIPRQATVAPGTRGLIDVSGMSDKFNNPEYSLQNLDEFSHIWGQCYKTFFVRNLRIFELNPSKCFRE